MKPIFFALSFLFFTTVNSQITYEFTPPAPVVKFSTTNLGDKFFAITDALDSNYTIQYTMTIYNPDWSIYKTVHIPDGYVYCDFNGGTASGATLPIIRSISDNLFNSDTLIEFLAYKYSTVNYQTLYKMAVINELGQKQFVFPDSSFSNNMPLFEVNGNFKTGFTSANTVAPKIYALPGTLPCNQCNYTTSIVNPDQSGGSLHLIAYPNPFTNTLVVDYDLMQQPEGQLTLTTVDGKVVNTVHLNRPKDRLELNTANLPKGIIIASVYDNNQQLISKKLVKIE